MHNRVANVAVLGSTGSIGQNALAVIAASEGSLRVFALSAHSSVAAAEAQACRFLPRYLVITDSDAAAQHDWSNLPSEVSLLKGPDALVRVVAEPEVDVVLSAIVGSAGLRGTWAALEAGKTVALANKETLVAAGPLVMEIASRHGASIVPIDSEHSALFQALQAGRRGEVHRLVLTASGGPFRRYTHEQLQRVTIEEALEHPTWDMGPKITIDSATMMNKALEIIEARWLFELSAEQIDVVIHPQSIVHSLVEFIDGSVVAQLSPPDMKLPIHYALHYPRRSESIAPKLDWSQVMRLDFEPPDPERFPALDLGREVAQAGGTAGAVLNAANEAAVGGFLAGELGFTEIVPVCRSVLQQHPFDPHPSMDELLRLDRWARSEVSRRVCT